MNVTLENVDAGISRFWRFTISSRLFVLQVELGVTGVAREMMLGIEKRQARSNMRRGNDEALEKAENT